MKTFVLYLQDSTRSQRIPEVVSFVGEDASGSFGIRAGHARFMTSLVFGLARFRRGNDPWQFLALPGALLYFVNNELFISTRRYLQGENYEQISQALQEQLLAEEERLHEMKQSLHRLEEEMRRRLWELHRLKA
ncbi:H+transporting two-sector ATPase delta/epsilon subunit [Nitrosococcus halophilus Nc 4]|uniref:ATP synthase epsilon chain n=1 Tax=Nitrosococcus halophilus (strain Nc4) TaxID=472759 RepID=D5C5A9_NITHN|nr:F0F1 ATP synthase subunit epsilon [Nitrosococcus halophilus]ADE15332.1 H+transporting two-sector ATPase delta/epsilon subunit [Nitrosococcus halophilus Nc 4]